MGACISKNKACACAGSRRRASCNNQNEPSNNSNINIADQRSDYNAVNLSGIAGEATETNDRSLNSLDNNNDNPASNNNTQQNTNTSENGSLNNLAMSMMNNSISYYSANSNPQPILIGSTMTNPSYYNSANHGSGSSPFVPPTGKNKRLKKDFIKNFKFDKKITEAQLNTKREEFWDTAPAFEGKIEIWTALKAAVEAYEQKNYQLAQVIIDSANIILPKGFLNDCYDELGNRYQIPIYVLAKPVNMRRPAADIQADNESPSGIIENDDSSLSPVNDKSAGKGKKIFHFDVQDDEDDDEDEIDDFNLNSLNIQKTKSNFFKNKLRFSKVKNNASNLIGSTSFSFEPNKKSSKSGKDANEGNFANNGTSQPGSNLQRSNSIEDFFQIKVRLSHMAYNENELKLRVTASQTVRQLKQQITDATDVEPARLRMFFGGKLMKDRQQLRVYKLRRNVVVQVIVREPKPSQIVVKELLNESEINHQLCPET